MGKIAQFAATVGQHSIVGVDSSVFIYTFEQHPQYEPFCRVLFKRLDEGVLELATSVVSISEVLVRPFERRDAEVIALYDQVFSQLPHLKIAPIDYHTAKLAAHLRAAYHILLPDAYQLAAALSGKATLFVTNDRALKKVSDLKVVCLKDYL